MEQIYQSNIAEHLGTLCDHFMAGENYEKGEIYAKLAAKKAAKAGSFPEAIGQSQKSIACLEKLPITDEDQKKMIDARTVLALYLAQLNHYVEAKEAIDPIIGIAEKSGYKRRLCQIKTILGAYYCAVEENFPAAFQAFKEALQIAGEVKDVVSLVLANFWFGIALSYNCEFEESTPYMQKAYDISAAARNLSGMASFKASLTFYCLFYPGMLDLGFQTSAEAVLIAEESGDSFSKGLAYTCHGASSYGKGLFEEAEEYLLRAVGFCERVNETFWNSTAHFLLGEVFFEKGDFPRSEEWYEKGFWLGKDTRQFLSLVNCIKVGLIRAKSITNPKGIDLESLYSHSKNIKMKVFQGWISSYVGAILMNLDDCHLTEAQTWIQKAIEEDQRNCTRFILGRDYALYAEWFKRKGDRPKARENLGKAVEIMKACGADGWVEKYEKELTALQ
jgi:tetratricopeptide (TPR) repeat protein